jgi:hypothetical protein
MALWNSVKNVCRKAVRAFLSEDVSLPASRQPPRFQVEVDGGLDIGRHGLKKLEVSSEDVVAYVSRHGYQQRGVTCPRCVWLAARPGEWEKVHENQWGEYVACGKCGRMLYASPNDDEGDPKPGATEGRMDPQYLKFVRPEGWKPPKQRTVSTPAKVGDWVVIEDYTIPAVVPDDGTQGTPARCLDQEEGRVLEFVQTDGGAGPTVARVALGGNVGIAGAHDMGANLVSIPLANIFVMVLPNFRKGDRVRIRQGALEGKEGEVMSNVEPIHATMSVRFTDGLQVQVPLLHIERIITNERPR